MFYNKYTAAAGESQGGNTWRKGKFLVDTAIVKREKLCYNRGEIKRRRGQRCC